MIKEKVTQEDLIFYEILRNPVLCTEFIQNIDKTKFDEPFELTYYQRDILLDFSNYVSIEAGRAVGKTVSLSSYIIWMLVFNLYPGDYIVYSVPSKANLDPVWSNLIRMFRTNSVLKLCIPPTSGVNSSEFTIKLLNQAQVMCRIAGQTGTGANVIGLHTPVFMVDESGYFPWATWIELQPAVNTFTKGYKLMVSGVPDGRREKSVNFYCDQEAANYSKFRISAFKNPRFTEIDKKAAIDNYGGEDSDDYIHLVLGEHGKPVFSLFDRSLMKVEDDPVYKLVLTGTDMFSDTIEYFNKLSLFPGIPNKHSKCIMGIDLGYTEPTAIVIMYTDNYNRLRFHGRIQLNKVSYPIQEKIIDFIDSKFSPSIIGIDAGGVGKPVVQHLLEGNEFLHKDYHKRLYPVDFSSMLILGKDGNDEDIKSRAKPYAVSILQEYSNNHKVVYSSTDPDMMTELERMTYTKSVNGDITYKTLTPLGGKRGEDHFTSGLLCGVLAYHMNYEFIATRQKKGLFVASWLFN